MKSTVSQNDPDVKIMRSNSLECGEIGMIKSGRNEGCYVTNIHGGTLVLLHSPRDNGSIPFSATWGSSDFQVEVRKGVAITLTND